MKSALLAASIGLAGCGGAVSPAEKDPDTCADALDRGRSFLDGARQRYEKDKITLDHPLCAELPYMLELRNQIRGACEFLNREALGTQIRHYTDTMTLGDIIDACTPQPTMIRDPEEQPSDNHTWQET